MGGFRDPGRNAEKCPGWGDFKNLANAFGVDPDKAEVAVASMMGALTERIDRISLSRGGVADILDLLKSDSVDGVLSNPRYLAMPDVQSAGNEILSVLTGNKDVSRGIAHRAAKASGLDEVVLRRMLPTVASMMIGGLQREAPGQISEKLQALVSAGGSPLPMPGDSIPPASPYPQQRGSGGTVLGGRPLQVPGNSIPGTGRNAPRTPADISFDDLPDILRRGGAQVPGGDDLSQMIRSILGGLLGFQPRGVFGWIFNLILSRWFIGIFGRFLSRIFLGR